jgi:hypothetical protein
MVSFKRMYSQYAKRRLENNEVVILLPYYETTDGVREVLSKNRINAKMRESQGFLLLLLLIMMTMTMDSYKMMYLHAHAV